MKKHGCRAFSLVLVLVGFASFASFGVEREARSMESSLPVIPAVSSWKPAGKGGTFRRLNLVVSSARAPEVATRFFKDAELMFGPAPATKDYARNIFFNLVPGAATEAYSIRIEPLAVTVSSSSPLGLFRASQTLLQLFDAAPGHDAIPCGVITDSPRYRVRGLMIDCGRKYIPLSFLRAYARILAYYKMNELHVHLNDNGFKQFFSNDWSRTYAAFRLECDTFPGLTAKDGSYSKADFRAFVKEAAALGVNVVPEIDAPAHSLAFTHYEPKLASAKYGADHLDLHSPLVRPFFEKLYAEYLSGPDPVFAGPCVSVGTDEYNRADAEAFRSFTDFLLRLVAKYGKHPRAWGALSHAAGKTPVLAEGVTMDIWYNPYYQPLEAIKAGYKIISIPDGRLYIVPAAGYYYDYLNLQNLFDTWEPRNVGGVTLDAADPALLGGKFAVWNDHVGNGISVFDIHDRLFPGLQVLAQKMWSGTVTNQPYARFHALALAAREAPGVNLAARVPAATNAVLSLFAEPAAFAPATVVTNRTLEAIGWTQQGGYTVAFDINPSAPGLVFADGASTVFLEKGTGKLGFARDGYTFTFDYVVPANAWTSLAISGDSRGTALFVGGKLVQRLQGARRTFPDTKSTTALIQTLRFPLREIGGGFSGRLRNLSVRTGQMR